MNLSNPLWSIYLGVFLAGIIARDVRAADLLEVEGHYKKGDYDRCIELAKEEVERTVWNENWPRLLIQSYLTTGQYAKGVAVYEATIERFTTSIRLRMLGAEAYRLTDQAKQARVQLDAIPEMVQRVPWRFTSRSELLALGEYYLQQGEDPKQVLELFFDKAIKEDPKFVAAHIASARLAINKRDDRVALASLRKAMALDETDPEIHYLSARAWSNSDSEKSAESIRRAIELNPKHIPSLLWIAESKIDREQYALAEELLLEVERINPNLPELWAYRAAIAHLEGRYEAEGEMRRRALRPWPLNPVVDHLIGKQLSGHYRFAESVEYQRRALMMQENYLAAKAQLAQDLLRLGETDEGWKLVDEARKADPYDVPIFNLTKLRGRLDKFTTLEAPGFVVRMDAREAKIYGASVLELLGEARRVLTEKYAVKLAEPTYVEIFPQQGDFAIRTFGLPGGDGFLGVCFGRLITANSPSALNVDSNWQSVLWHEYCHVVTLQKTKNRMPRWLSEGISVYEERRRDPRWGQGMTPTYRQMILGEEFVPVSRLSGAFLQPKSPMHLQFAYYESSLVVQYWIEKYGLASLQRVLQDLSGGLSANEALGREPGGIEALDQEFAEYARDQANKLGQGKEVDFSPLEPPLPRNGAGWLAWLEEHPSSYSGLYRTCQALLGEERWEEALPLIDRLIAFDPEDGSAESGYALKAAAYRGLKKHEAEREALVMVDRHCPDCIDALTRLIELDRERGNDAEVLKWARRALEIDPLRPAIHESRAAAAEQAKELGIAADSLRSLLELDPIDIAAVHFRLAQAIVGGEGDRESAKRHLLMALEESPRYRDALELLLELTAGTEEVPANRDPQSSLPSSPAAEQTSGEQAKSPSP